MSINKLLHWISTALSIGIIGVVIFSFIDRSPVSPHTGTQEKLRITTSFYPLYFFASEIGGDRAQVVNITPPGTEPHDLELTPSDMRSIADSRLIIANGFGMEAWIDNIRTMIDPSQGTILIVGERLTGAFATLPKMDASDPHVWLSPPLAIQMTEKIRDAMIQASPADADHFTDRSARLIADLDALDQRYRSGLDSCRKKEFVTTHNAFAYLANTYGLTQVPIAGLSPDAEPSAKQLTEITDFIRSRGVNVIFFETLASPKLAETIARETGATTLVLDPIEGILPSEMANGSNYLTIMETNLLHLQQALECTPS